MKVQKTQFNMRIKRHVLAELKELAAARGVKPSRMAAMFLEDWWKNRCRRCRGRGRLNKSILVPIKPCPTCRGTGRRVCSAARGRLDR